MQPGELVVKRVRWHADANLVGVIVSVEPGNVLVLWTIGDQRSRFKWHPPDALLEVDSHMEEVKRRCALVT